MESSPIKLNFDKPIFVIERCQDCKNHNWNTRHDEAKYIGQANGLASRIKAKRPEATVLINSVPKMWHNFDIYFGLVPNDEKEEECYAMVPKRGAFEVSTVAQVGGQSEAILFFSKA